MTPGRCRVIAYPAVPVAASVREGPDGLRARREPFDTGKMAYAEYLRHAEGDVPIMTPERRSLEALEETFDRRFHNFPETRLPGENVRERRKGSLPYGSGRLYYVFGEEDGREFLETTPTTGWASLMAGIYDDGTSVGLPELCSMYGYDPKIPGDEERKEAEMQKEYRETLDDLIAKGLFDDEPIPGSLAINSYLVLHDADGSEMRCGGACVEAKTDGRAQGAALSTVLRPPNLSGLPHRR